MATKLFCPQCRQDLIGSFSRGAAGVCPICRANFAAPQVKAARTSAVVPRAQPYRPPPQLDTAKRWRKWFPRIAVSTGFVAIIACLAWWNRAPGQGEIESLPTAALPVSLTSSLAAKAPATIEAPAEIITPQSTIHPRARVVPKIDALIDRPAPISMSPPSKPFSKAVEQASVDQAIHRGIEFLIKNTSSWLNVGGHEVGYAALPALALLEAGVAKDEPVVIEAALLVRRKAPQLQDTYDIALAILFLDRLGVDSDKSLIRSLALRLLAGQTAQYGWDYRCPRLATELEAPLHALLDKLQPDGRWHAPLAREPGQGLVALAVPLRSGRDSSERTSLEAPREPGPAEAPAAVHVVKPMALGDVERTKNVVKDFPAALRSLAVVQPMPSTAEAKTKGKAKVKEKVSSQDDNSNTQFALLGLWAARRQGVPVDRALLLADQRFAKSQLSDGSWGYRIGDRSGKPSMTTVGLLGLALGHGALLPDHQEPNRPAPLAGADAAIERGLEALGRSIGTPTKRPSAPTPNLYLLWSLERVAMIYQLPTIGGKDWYGWGANDLIASQRADGGWAGSGYHGSAPPLDTAFALLFLRRSNLVPDLTERLQLHMAITDANRR